MSDERERERAFRNCLGAFATGVVMVTTDGAEGGPAGIVVNSFTSVSLRPPLVLWCLGDASDRFALFSKAERWAVNVLAADQQAYSSRVSKPGATAIGDLPLDELAGVPVLAGALSHIVCRTSERRSLGDHLVIVGAVEAFAGQAGDALTYYRGLYGRAVAGA
jgi:flavin reductase (DIM6/NTAB) family NADH-FMN oxidoreductase RutF